MSLLIIFVLLSFYVYINNILFFFFVSRESVSIREFMFQNIYLGCAALILSKKKIYILLTS